MLTSRESALLRDWNRDAHEKLLYQECSHRHRHAVDSRNNLPKIHLSKSQDYGIHRLWEPGANAAGQEAN